MLYMKALYEDMLYMKRYALYALYEDMLYIKRYALYKKICSI